MRYCTSCGVEVGQNAAFCRACGNPVPPNPAGTLGPTKGGPPPDPWPTQPIEHQRGPDPEQSSNPQPSPPAYRGDSTQDWHEDGRSPSQPGDPYDPPPDQRRSHAGAIIALVVAAVLVVILAGGAVWLVGRGGTPPRADASGPAPTSTRSATSTSTGKSSPAPRHSSSSASVRVKAAATKVSMLLNQSVPARSTIRSAMGGLASCHLQAQTAVAEMEGVVQTRQRLLTGVASAPFQNLPSGERLRGLLTSAWTASKEADQAYLSWAEDKESSGDCGTNDQGYQDGNDASARAEHYKTQFVRLWNSAVASKVGSPRISESQI